MYVDPWTYISWYPYAQNERAAFGWRPVLCRTVQARYLGRPLMAACPMFKAAYTPAMSDALFFSVGMVYFGISFISY